MSDLISRQAALDVVNDCGICIQKILDLPSANNLISRQAAIDAVNYNCTSLKDIKRAINNLPSAEPKRGKWIDNPDPYGFFETIPVCSFCGCTTKWREKYLYCPHCGSRMEVTE